MATSQLNFTTKLNAIFNLTNVLLAAVIMNGKKLTKAQIAKVERIDKLFAELKKEGIVPMILEGGGSPTLTFWRNADLDVDILYKNNPSKNIYHSAKTVIDMWVP